MNLRKAHLIFIGMVIFFPMGLKAHPGDGIAADSRGNIYFTDVNTRTVWKYTQENQLTAVVRNRWSHGLCIDNLDRIWIEVEVDNTKYSVKCISADGTEKHILGPMERGPDFYGVNIIADSHGNLYFPYSSPPAFFFSGIKKRTADGHLSVLAGGSHYGHRDGEGKQAEFMGIRAMRMTRDGSILVVDEDSVRSVSMGGHVKTIRKGIIEQNPTDQPFDNGNPSVSNRLYGLDQDDSGNIYVAYHGNRRVIKISPDGGMEVVYRPVKPWSPVGVAVWNNSLYIKESGLEPGSRFPGPRIRKLEPNGEISTIVTITPENPTP